MPPEEIESVIRAAGVSPMWSTPTPTPNPNPNPNQERCERALFERLHQDPSHLERRQAVTMALDVALT